MDRPLKQRLWGAAVLVALAVIFLPMLIKGPAPDSGVADVPLDAPAQPDGITTQELPLNVPGGPGAGGATGMPAPQAGTPTAMVDTPVPSTQAAAGDFAVNFGTYGSAADADRVVQALTGIQLKGYREAVSLGGREAFRVRIGPYASREAAEAARIAAGKLNAPVQAQVIALDAGAPTPSAPTTATAVQAQTSPVATVNPAEAKPIEKPAEPKPVVQPKPVAAAPVETKPAAAPVEAKPVAAKPAPTEPKPVAPAKPVEAKPLPATQPVENKPVAAKPADTKPAVEKPTPVPAPKPAASGTGFTVQLGAFANAAEANALRDRARAAGFSAMTDTVQTEKGRLTRVRLGPVASRADADALRGRAASKLGVTGIVRPTP